MTTELPEMADASGIVAALAAAEKPAQILDHTADDHVLVVATRDEILVINEDLERFLPEPVRPRGTVKALSADGFVAAYRARTVDDAEYGAPIYADPDSCALVAVLNDDYGPHAGWRDHRIELALQTTPEWDHWTSRQGLGPQARFAETIEGGETEIREPTATTMLEIAQTFEASVGAKFKQKARLKDGRTQLVYEEDIDAKAQTSEGLVEIPDSFTIEVRPFYGAQPRLAQCRIRWRLKGGELQIGYSIYRPDEIRREAFSTDVLGFLNEQLPAATVIEGQPASPTSAGR